MTKLKKMTETKRSERTKEKRKRERFKKGKLRYGNKTERKARKGTERERESE